MITMTENDSTTFRIGNKGAETLREFCIRTHTSQIDFMNLLMEQVQLLLDLQESGKRLLWMVDLYNKDNVPKVIIRLSDALYSSLDEIPPELQKKVLEGFDYSTDGKFTDLRGKKPDVDPIQQKPQPPQEAEQK